MADCIKAIEVHKNTLAQAAQVIKALGLPLTKADEMALFEWELWAATLSSIEASR